MEIKLNRENGVPIYIQLKKQIKDMVEKGILTKGDRLPPERELAEKLKISRNRVSTAYKELEAENIVNSHQGKGTFVAGKVVGIREMSRKDKLLRIIDLALEEALALGFSFDDFLTIAYVRAREKEEMLSKIKIVFIECNKEQLEVLIKETELDQQIASIKILLEKLREDPEQIKKTINKADMIVTTPFHINEVEEFLAGMDKQIIDMTLEPRMNTIVEMARIKSNSKVGLVCPSDSFAREFYKSLAKIGLDNLDIKYTTDKGAQLETFVDNQEILISSPRRFKEVSRLVNDGRKIIRFDFAPDRGSINMLKTALIELKSTFAE